MKRVLTTVVRVGLCSAFVVGCADTTVSKTQTKVNTPGGTTTTTTTTEKTGDKPAPPKPN
jgi:hypothetical protein